MQQMHGRNAKSQDERKNGKSPIHRHKEHRKYT